MQSIVNWDNKQIIPANFNASVESHTLFSVVNISVNIAVKLQARVKQPRCFLSPKLHHMLFHVVKISVDERLIKGMMISLILQWRHGDWKNRLFAWQNVQDNINKERIKA